MMCANNLTEILVQLLVGDLSQLEELLSAKHQDIWDARQRLASCKLGKEGVLNVLHGLRDGVLRVAPVQRWASFMRRGYVEARGGLPIRAIDIGYDSYSEDVIVDIIGRLDELGDEVDGEVEAQEIDHMIGTLRNQGINEK